MLLKLAGLATVAMLVVLVTVVVVRERRGGPTETVATEREAERPLGGERSGAAAGDQGRAIRRRVEAAVDRAVATTTADALPSRLEELLARARAQGRVTALEAEVGSELIERLGGDLRMEMAFNERLNQLARELRHEPPVEERPTAEQTMARLETLAGRLATEKDAVERQALVQQYQGAADLLDPGAQAKVLTRLNELVGPPPAPRPRAGDIAERFAAVGATTGAQREAAIQAFLDVVERLPPEEEIAQRRRLDALVSGTATSRPPSP